VARAGGDVRAYCLWALKGTKGSSPVEVPEDERQRIPVPGLRRTNRQLWFACIESLLDVVLRLLPLDGDTEIELNVEQRGKNDGDTDGLLSKTLDDAMYRLSLTNPDRARQIHLTGHFIGKRDCPLNGYADVVAYSWVCPAERPWPRIRCFFAWSSKCIGTLRCGACRRGVPVCTVAVCSGGTSARSKSAVKPSGLCCGTRGRWSLSCRNWPIAAVSKAIATFRWTSCASSGETLSTVGRWIADATASSAVRLVRDGFATGEDFRNRLPWWKETEGPRVWRDFLSCGLVSQREFHDHDELCRSVAATCRAVANDRTLTAEYAGCAADWVDAVPLSCVGQRMTVGRRKWAALQRGEHHHERQYVNQSQYA